MYNCIKLNQLLLYDYRMQRFQSNAANPFKQSDMIYDLYLPNFVLQNVFR